ncbi:MAG: hypothetical protein K2H64_02625 [Desulfovibrio sp.]|nr:hypothetical protein [Desulfovibrio sp.]
MYLLNSGRYVIGDPEAILNEKTLKKLWENGGSPEFRVLKTSVGAIIALSAGRRGVFHTSIGKPIASPSAHIAFVPYPAAGKLLATGLLRITLRAPALLFHNADSDIELDGRLYIYCSSMPPLVSEAPPL